MSEPSGSARRTIEAHSADVKDADGQSLTFVSDWCTSVHRCRKLLRLTVDALAMSASPFAQRTWIALEQSRVPYKYKVRRHHVHATKDRNRRPCRMEDILML